MAFWFDLDAEHVIIEDCVAVGNWNSLSDYLCEVSWDGLIKDNIAFGCHQGTVERTVTIPFKPYVSMITGLPAGAKPTSS